jgi:hypothetical protein
VSGGTATVDVSGVNPLEIVAGSNVNITGGTNGEVVIGATGGTSSSAVFPDFTNGTSISGGTTYGPFSYPVWVVGNVQNYTGADATGSCQCRMSLNGSGFSNITIWLMFTSELKCTGEISDYVPDLYNHVSFPIPSGVTFYINPSFASDTATLDLAYYPCI